MKVLILGGGIAGVTTAYYLGRDGHEVTLLEANPELGLEATSGNAGIIAPGHSFAWGSPKAPGMLVRSLLGHETAIRMRLKPDLRLYLWGLKFLRECTAARARHNTLIKLRLCQYSQTVMNELVRAEKIDYHAVTRGGDWRMDVAPVAHGLRMMAFDGARPVLLLAPGAEARLAHAWYEGVHLAEERARGLDDRDDHLHAATVHATGFGGSRSPAALPPSAATSTRAGKRPAAVCTTTWVRARSTRVIAARSQ